MNRIRKSLFRCTVLAAIFALVVVIYLGRLFYIQISGRENTYDAGTVTRTVAIQAVRGEIYDRNGKPLVTNRYTYDLAFHYQTLTAMNVYKYNRTMLSLIGAMETCHASDLHEEKFFPFLGSYPYYRLSEEAQDPDSVIGFRLARVISDAGLRADTTPEQLREYYVRTYQLLDTDASGARLFDDDQIDSLIRLYYDMDARRFAKTAEYTYAENVSFSLITYIKELNLQGVNVTVNADRVYNYPGYASHILGTVGPIYSEEWQYYNAQGYQMNAVVGKTGCEYAFESYLHGMDGEMEIVEDSAGNVLSATVKKEAVAGSDIRLTIDIDLQIAAENGLRDNVADVVARADTFEGEETRRLHGIECCAGAAVAMDPDTFDVLAIASYPSFDLTTYNRDYNELSADPASPLLNRALLGTYAPGSTFKLGVAVAALMEGEITPSSTVSCTGSYHDLLGCSTYGTSHSGPINVVRAIAVSCNSFFCEMGARLGIDRMETYLSRFGVGRSTGLELGGATGALAGPTYLASIRSDKEWTAGLTWQAAIGQSDNLVSPLQLGCYISTLANGGTRYTAHLLDSVYTYGSDVPAFVYEQTEETILDRTDIPESVLDTVYSGMREVVTSNSTVSLNMKNVPVAVGGKTGTAQNSTGVDHAVFVCTAPVTDPEISVAVILEQGYSGGFASLTAARILETYYAAK